jgi:hypothetical protein
MAEEAKCSKVTIINIRRNLRQSGSVHAPSTRIGRKPTVTPLSIDAHCDHLSEKPGLYLDEMAVFLWDGFHNDQMHMSYYVVGKTWQVIIRYTSLSVLAVFWDPRVSMDVDWRLRMWLSLDCSDNVQGTNTHIEMCSLGIGGRSFLILHLAINLAL